ncbi:MAG: FixH family protein [Hyphomicrobiaceae bacterium]
MATAKTERGTIQGWHVLVGMIAFFGIIFAVNGVFLVSALNTHTGIVSKQPYRKGLDYNDRIAADARQRKLGWAHTIVLDQRKGDASLVLSDKLGRPISGLDVQGVLGRPSTERYDMRLAMQEAGTPGTYSAKVGALEPGNWLLQVEAREKKSDGAEVVYRLRKRLWLKP